MPEFVQRGAPHVALSVLRNAPPPAAPAAPSAADVPRPAPKDPARIDDRRRAELIDDCGRRIDHLRVSVTSACDLRCTYCRPSVCSHDGGSPLTDAQRVELIACLHDRFGLSQIRLTGGEPLLHRSLVELIAELRTRLPGIGLAMTTNGQHLASRAVELRRAGLDRLNISLDSLNPRRYAAITGGRLGPVLDGIDAAITAGFPPPRINCVVLRGANDAEIASLADWSIARRLEIRFLEAMPIGPAAAANRARFVPAAQIRAALAARFRLTPLPPVPGQTARRYRAVPRPPTGRGGTIAEPARPRIDAATFEPARFGVVGIIAPVSEPFCSDCRRMRLTADGRLFPCLLDSRSVDLRRAWIDDQLSNEAAAHLVRAAVEDKRPSGPRLQSISMITLGG